MQRRFAQRLTRIRASDEPRKATEAESRFVFVFVPGLFYKSRPQTGAAMERPRQLLQRAGFETRLVPTDESDTVEKNARLLADYLRAARAWHRPLILVSASKGGAEVAHALGGILAGKNLEHVRGWVSIGGILRGTPLADGGLEWPTNWLLGLTGWVHGTSLGWVKSVSTGPSGRRAATHVFPTHLQVLHYVGVPLSGSVSDAVRGRYKKLRRYGPTDGITRLPDQILPQGHIVLAVGSDHRFVDPEFDKKALALAELILELVDPSP